MKTHAFFLLIVTFLLSAATSMADAPNSDGLRFYSQDHGKNVYVKMSFNAEKNLVVFQHCFGDDNHCEALGDSRGHDIAQFKANLAAIAEGAGGGLLGKAVHWMLHPIVRTLASAVYVGGAEAVLEGGGARYLPFFLIGAPALAIGIPAGGMIIGGTVAFAGTTYLVLTDPRQILTMSRSVFEGTLKFFYNFDLEILLAIATFLPQHPATLSAMAVGGYLGYSYLPDIFRALGLGSSIHTDDILDTLFSDKKALGGWIVLQQDIDGFVGVLKRALGA